MTEPAWCQHLLLTPLLSIQIPPAIVHPSNGKKIGKICEWKTVVFRCVSCPIVLLISVPNLSVLTHCSKWQKATPTKHTGNYNYIRAVVVAQLVERSLPIPEVRSSIPVIGKQLFICWTFVCCQLCIEKTKIKRRAAGNGPFKKIYNYISVENTCCWGEVFLYGWPQQLNPNKTNRRSSCTVILPLPSALWSYLCRDCSIKRDNMVKTRASFRLPPESSALMENKLDCFERKHKF